MDVPKPYEFIGSGTMDVPKPYACIGFGSIHGPRPCKCIGLRWAFISQTPVMAVATLVRGVVGLRAQVLSKRVVFVLCHLYSSQIVSL